VTQFRKHFRPSQKDIGIAQAFYRENPGWYKLKSVHVKRGSKSCTFTRPKSMKSWHHGHERDAISAWLNELAATH